MKDIEHQVKLNLMRAIREIMKEDGLTQAQTAKKLKVSQPRVSDLVNDKSDLFSFGKLFKFLTCLNRKVTMTYDGVDIIIDIKKPLQN